jgi:glycosyltransferase involved in cell wall biosynthesis
LYKRRVDWSYLKILRIITRLNIGGPARHVTLLNAGLQERRHQTLLIHGVVPAGEAPLAAVSIGLGIAAVQQPHLVPRISLVNDLRAFGALVAAIFRQSPDVVHTHTAKAGALGRLAALLYNSTRRRRRRCFVVHTYHGNVFEGYFHPVANRAIRLTERALALATDRIVTVSPSQQRDIVERFAIAAKPKTAIVRLGLDLESLLQLPAQCPASFRAALDVEPDDIVVGSFGRMVAIKDLPTLVRAFALALQRNPKLQLVMAGDGPMRPAVEALVEQLRIGKRVHLLGWTDDLPRLYATIDICALASLNEGTPVTVIEAMAAGKPTVATAVGGMSDMVEHEVTGLLVPPRNVDALAAAIHCLAADRGRRQRMGEAARKRATAMYSLGRLVTDVEELYTTGLAAKRRTMKAG